MQNASSTYSFVIVGYGHIGKRHAAILNNMPNVILKGIVEPNKSQFDKTIEEHLQFNSLEEFIKIQTADIAIIAAPNGLHANLAIKAIEAEMHVIIEKPMDINSSACSAIIQKANQYNKQVFVVKQNRYSPPAMWLKSVIDNKIIGKVLLVQINCFWNRDQRYYKNNSWKGTLALDGGPLYTQFSHFIDILYWIFGDIENITARFFNHTHLHNTEFEDAGLVQFNLVNGGSGSFNYSTSVPVENMESSITVIGEFGSIKIGGQYMNHVEHCSIKNYQMPSLEPTAPSNNYGNFSGSASNHEQMLSNVLLALNGESHQITNAYDGLKVVDMIERIYLLRDLNKIRN